MDLVKIIPTIVSVLVMVLAAFADPIQHAVSSNPLVSVLIAGLYSILSHFLPSPTAAKPEAVKPPEL